MSAEKDDREAGRPTQTVYKEALHFFYGLFGLYVLQFLVSIAFGVWFYYTKPNEALSSRIIGGLLVTMATFFVFDSLGKICGFLAARHLQKLLNKSNASKVDFTEHWYSRLSAVLVVLQGITTLAVAVCGALYLTDKLDGVSRYDASYRFFSQLFFFCGVYLIAEICWSLFRLILAI